MSNKGLTATLTVLIAIATLSNTGCVGITLGPDLGILGIPIPVSPYFQKRMEDKAWIQERYKRVPILGPLNADAPTIGLDEPSDDEVMWALERARPTQGGIPLFHEVQRNDVRIIKELIADYIDPPRVVPLLGPVQLHHVHYKCTVHYSETTNVGWPLPHQIRDQEAVEVIYIDKNHFHMVGNVDTGVGSNY